MADYIELGESLRPAVALSISTLKAQDVSIQFMLLHVHCADYANGQMKFNEGESKTSRYEDSSEYVVDDDSDSNENLLARIVLFGSNLEGNSICISVKNYRPWIRVQVRDNLSESEVKLLKSYFEKNLADPKSGRVIVTLENRKKFYGWQPDSADPSKTRTFSFAKISFDSFAEATKAANKCKPSSFNFNRERNLLILDLVDVQIKPNSRFCNDLGITLSDWVLLRKSKDTTLSFAQSNWASRFSNCQIEIECDVSAIAPAPITDNRIAPLLIGSIDGEMYSDDGSFPDFLKGDNTIYIGISLWFYGSPLSSIKRVMFCVSEDNPAVHAKEQEEQSLMSLYHFSSSREMFEGFRDFVIACDPDVLTGWNTFGFDYPFLYGEYKQSYLPQGERGSEKLQLALLSKIPFSASLESAIPLSLSKLDTAAELLSKIRSSSSYAAVSNWISKMNYNVGISFVNLLIKEEKILQDKRGSSRNLSSYSSSSSSSFSSSYSFNNNNNNGIGKDDEDEDENENEKEKEDEEEDDVLYVSSAGLSGYAAKLFRLNLLDEFPSLAISSKAGDWNDAFTIVKKMPSSVQKEFKENIFQYFPHSISSMLLQRRPLKIVQRGFFLSRFASEKCDLVEKRMSSAARGDNVYSYIGMTGRINIDLMQIIKDDKKPESNTLKFASKTFLGQAKQEKIDLSASDMFAAYKSGDLKKRWEIAEYCARDCDIPILLISKLSYMPTWIEMSRVCYTSFHDVVNSGQQVKVMNLIARFVKDDYAINLRDSGWPDNELDDDENTNSFKKVAPDYEGATVIEPVTGFYEDCVSTLDFESLYPSIIRYFNLCPSTLILDADVLAMGLTPSSSSTSSSSSSTSSSTLKTESKVSFETHVIKNNVLINRKLLKYEVQDRKYTFVMHVTGVLPSLLKRLIDARKAVKKLMNESKDPAEKAVLNGRQNGLKVACNSCYGFCGVSKKRGLMPCKPVAAVTTLKGRLFIDFSKNFTEKTYPGSKVIYGDTDSVMVLWGKGTTVERANELGEEAANKITAELREGKITEIGGAGSLSASISSSTQEWRGRKDLAEACSAVRLTNEKVYFPYLLLKKKNYAAIKFTSDGKGGFKEELDMKGIDAVRRDRSQLVRDASNAILHSLLYERSVVSAMKVLRQQLLDMAEGKIPIQAFVLSKSLKSNYSSSNLPHVMAWKRMLERGDEGAPPVGARMPYVILSDTNGLGGKETAAKLYERSEHPDFASTSGRKLDYPYYIESLFNPLYKLLQFCNVQDLKSIFRDANDLASNKLKNVSSLKRFLSSPSPTPFLSDLSGVSGITTSLSALRETPAASLTSRTPHESASKRQKGSNLSQMQKQKQKPKQNEDKKESKQKNQRNLADFFRAPPFPPSSSPPPSPSPPPPSPSSKF